MTLSECLFLTSFYNPIQVYNLLAGCKPYFFLPLEQSELMQRLETSENYLKDFEVQKVIEDVDVVKIYV